MWWMPARSTEACGERACTTARHFAWCSTLPLTARQWRSGAPVHPSYTLHLRYGSSSMDGGQECTVAQDHLWCSALLLMAQQRNSNAPSLPNSKLIS